MWAASSILWQTSEDGRTAAMARLIAVAEHLRKLNNFSSTFAIISALQTSAIYRLKSREKVPKKAQKIVEELLDLLSSKGSFKVLIIHQLFIHFHTELQTSFRRSCASWYVVDWSVSVLMLSF
jgi:hypothetical protein